MTSADYIEAVKEKLEEISPFSEPSSFIASGDSEESSIKPIQSYIESELDNAAKYCLNSLPLSLLSKDVTTASESININNQGVGVLPNKSKYLRLVRVHDNGGVWKRDVTSFMSTSNPLYLLQQNVFTRGGVAKPVVVYNPEEQRFELYSFPKNLWGGNESFMLYYIDADVEAKDVQSNIEDYIILVCAMRVSEILQDTNRASVLQEEFQQKVATIVE